MIPFKTGREAVTLARHGSGASFVARDPRRLDLGQHLRPLVVRDTLRRLQAVRLRRDRSPHAIDKYMDFKTIWTHYR